jgi:hypothetical protein
MTALANSLKRLWSANNRIPRQTRRGIFGSSFDSHLRTGLALRVREGFHALKEIVQRNIPAVIALACSFFR